MLVVEGGSEDVGVFVHASWTPSDHIHGLRVLFESGEIMDFAFIADCFNVPYPDMRITSCSCQSSFAMRLEMGRVDGVGVVVPSHQQRCCLHRALSEEWTGRWNRAGLS